MEYYGGNLIAESVSPNNVDLISAAPEMYEALEETCIKCKGICLSALGVNCKCCKTNKALRKAGGKKPWIS